jgi:hypothetical protein
VSQNNQKRKKKVKTLAGTRDKGFPSFSEMAATIKLAMLVLPYAMDFLSKDGRARFNLAYFCRSTSISLDNDSFAYQCGDIARNKQEMYCDYSEALWH